MAETARATAPPGGTDDDGTPFLWRLGPPKSATTTFHIHPGFVRRSAVPPLPAGASPVGPKDGASPPVYKRLMDDVIAPNAHAPPPRPATRPLRVVFANAHSGQNFEDGNEAKQRDLLTACDADIIMFVEYRAESCAAQASGTVVRQRSDCDAAADDSPWARWAVPPIELGAAEDGGFYAPTYDGKDHRSKKSDHGMYRGVTGGPILPFQAKNIAANTRDKEPGMLAQLGYTNILFANPVCPFGDNWGNVVRWKDSVPVEESGTIELPATESKIFRGFRTREGRVAVWIKLAGSSTGAKPLYVVTTHLENENSAAGRALRIQQATVLSAKVSEFRDAGGDVLLVGDVNNIDRSSYSPAELEQMAALWYPPVGGVEGIPSAAFELLKEVLPHVASSGIKLTSLFLKAPDAAMASFHGTTCVPVYSDTTDHAYLVVDVAGH